MATPYPLRLRGFLEGVEVPIVAATVTVAMDAPAQCAVQLPATDKALEFLPRTLVHIFFNVGEMTAPPTLTVEGEEEAEQVTAFNESEAIVFSEEEAVASDTSAEQLAGPVAETPPGGVDLQENPFDDDAQWKLFFAGEVTGYQLVKRFNQRALVLQCLDLSNYWDTCYQYQVNVSNIFGDGVASFVGAGESVFDTFFESATSSIIDIVQRRSFSRPELGGLLGGIVHLLERVGGVYGSRGFRGVNDFFTLAELRLHLVDMIGASEDDTSSQRLFPARAYNAWTRREGGQLPKIASFRDMLNLVNKFIFHAVAPNPIARYESPSEYQRSRSRTVETGGRPQTFLESPQWVNINNRINSALSTLQRYQQSTAPVSRNGLSRSMGQLASTIRSIKDSAVAAQNSSTTPQNPGQGVPIQSRLHRAGTHVQSLATMLSSFEENDRVIVTLRAGNTFEYAAFFRRQSVSATITEAFDELAQASASLTSLSGSATATRSATRTTTETVRRGGRLYSQIIRPDIFMVPPPRCNVLFPELYSSFQSEKQWLRMVTRMRMTMSDELFGPNMLLDSVYFAPNMPVLGARLRQGSVDDRSTDMSLRTVAYGRRLMEHELLTGPIPVFERMNDINVLAARQQGTTVRGARLSYVDRAVNHQFIKHRVSPHTANIEGPFNPFLVCGFPALLIDRAMTGEQVALSNLRGNELLEAAQLRNWAGLIEGTRAASEQDEAALEAWLALRETVPTQHLGMIDSIQHTVSNDSGRTAVTLSHVRTHRDNDELLGANVVNVARRDATQTTAQTTVAALETDPPVVGALGPGYGELTEVERLDTTSGQYKLYGTFSGSGPRRFDSFVQVGVTQAAHLYGPEVVTLVGARDTQVTFRAYRVTESIDRVTDRSVVVPFEQWVRPPWMSDVWANDRIGGVYQQLFGTGSLTDPLSVIFDRTEATEEDASVQDPLGEGRTHQSAGMEISVERAVDLAVRTYSQVVHSGLNVMELVRSYVWRPIATLTDILGSRDLTIDGETGEVTAGREGFHSRAFGHGALGTNIANLIPQGSNAERILGLDVSERRAEMSRYDMRARKAERVLAYADDIRRNRVLMG
jgi:hypothetical protein